MDDSFEVNAEPVRAGVITSDTQFTDENIELFFKKLFKKQEQYSVDDFALYGEVTKGTGAWTTDYFFSFLLGLQTDDYGYDGSIYVDGKKIPTHTSIYFLHSNDYSSQTIHHRNVFSDDYTLNVRRHYYEASDDSPCLFWISKGNGTEFNVYITHTETIVYKTIENDEEVIEEIKLLDVVSSLLSIDSQVLQICDAENNVLAEITDLFKERKDKKKTFNFVTYIDIDDERYEGVITTIGLVTTYISVCEEFKSYAHLLEVYQSVKTDI